MGDKSQISWTDATWNPTTGCSRVSEGCRNCYAEQLAGTRMAHLPDYAGTTRPNAAGLPLWTGKVNLLEHKLDLPLRRKKPRMIFVNSMSDLFHEEIPFEFTADVFAVIRECPQHIFQILTKRPRLMAGFVEWWQMQYVEDFRRCHPNVWLGVSVENQETANERIPLLLDTPAAVRFVSAEPLLGEVDFTNVGEKHWCCHNALTGAEGILNGYDKWEWGDPNSDRKLDWVIVGGESGKNARPIHPNWARQIRDDCVAAGVPFFFKQFGEWMPVSDEYVKYRKTTKNDVALLNYDGKLTRPENPKETHVELGYEEWMERVGKHTEGNDVLDGREWKEFPLSVISERVIV